MSSSQLTNSNFFQRGSNHQPDNEEKEQIFLELFITVYLDDLEAKIESFISGEGSSTKGVVIPSPDLSLRG